jgi:hypothetical protein
MTMAESPSIDVAQLRQLMHKLTDAGKGTLQVLYIWIQLRADLGRRCRGREQRQVGHGPTGSWPRWTTRALQRRHQHYGSWCEVDSGGPGAGLLYSAVSNTCAMAKMLSRLKYNRSEACASMLSWPISSRWMTL